MGSASEVFAVLGAMPKGSEVRRSVLLVLTDRVHHLCLRCPKLREHEMAVALCPRVTVEGNGKVTLTNSGMDCFQSDPDHSAMFRAPFAKIGNAFNESARRQRKRYHSIHPYLPPTFFFYLQFT